MFEYHGWVTVRDSLDGDCEAADCLTHATHNAVVDVLGRVRNDLQFADIRVVNGSCHVLLSGLRNHRQDAVIDVYREVATAAPWSYGVLYIQDDESGDDANRWVTWVMKRGAITPHPDRFLSPHIGEVEDADDVSR